MLRPANLPKLDAIQIDGIGAALRRRASAVTAMLFGLIPAFRAAGIDLSRTLRAAGSASAAQVRAARRC